MQIPTKKKSFRGLKGLENTADESLICYKSSSIKGDDSKSSTFTPKSSELVQNLDYICQTLQKQNKDTQLLINKLLDNYC